MQGCSPGEAVPTALLPHRQGRRSLRQAPTARYGPPRASGAPQPPHRRSHTHARRREGQPPVSPINVGSSQRARTDQGAAEDLFSEGALQASDLREHKLRGEQPRSLSSRPGACLVVCVAADRTALFPRCKETQADDRGHGGDAAGARLRATIRTSCHCSVVMRCEGVLLFCVEGGAF